MAETKTAGAIARATNGAVQTPKKVNFSSFIKNSEVQKSLVSTLGDMAKAKTFTASLISAVTTNGALMACDPTSIISAALLGEALKLSPSPQLGQFYMVPYKNKKAGVSKATFQLGWKGYYQLAMRSGQYKHLDAVEIKEGELVSYNPITKDVELNPILDPVARDNSKTIGYYAYFELINGFQKAIYWSRESMEKHALTYSKAYAWDKSKGEAESFWSKDFDEMALKTMYRQLIGKFGVMSIEMQQAFTNDMTFSDYNTETGESEGVTFFDNNDGSNDDVIDIEMGEATDSNE